MMVKPPNSTPSAHPSLLLDRYLVQEVTRLEGKETPENEEWRRLINISPPSIYKFAFERWKKALAPVSSTTFVRRAREGQVVGRFVTGLGAEGVFEVNVRTHHTYGVPFVPATGLKGALRAYMEDTLGHRAEAGFLFGTSEWAGTAKIYDAWYVPASGSSASGLQLDVISVHHPKYYRKEGPPTDFDQPTPIHFLTARGKFWFAFDAPTVEWADYLDNVLKAALTQNGVGAKKSSGYGRFKF